LLRAINNGTLPAFAGGFIPNVPTSVIAPPDPASLVRSGAPTVLQFDLRGAVVTQDLLDQMNAISARHATAAAAAGAQMAQSDIADRQSQRIPV
jgi:hypothetical protein